MYFYVLTLNLKMYWTDPHQILKIGRAWLVLSFVLWWLKGRCHGNKLINGANSELTCPSIFCAGVPQRIGIATPMSTLTAAMIPLHRIET